MSDSYVLDTSVVLNLIRGNALGKKIDQAFGLTSAFHRQLVSIVTEAELWVMADRNDWGSEKRAALQHALDSLVIIPIDSKDMVQAYVDISTVDLAAAAGARNMGKNDIWIAATALYTELPLLTTDKDFRFLNNKLLQVMWVDPSGV